MGFLHYGVSEHIDSQQVESQNVGRQYKCPNCGYICMQSATFARHWRKCNQIHKISSPGTSEHGRPMSESGRMFHSCGDNFVQSCSFDRHRRLYCKEATKSVESDNKRQAFPKKTGKRFPCYKCGATFAQSGTLGRHRRMCEGRYELLCLFCGMNFYRKDLYREHLMVKHQYVDEQLGAPGTVRPRRK